MCNKCEVVQKWGNWKFNKRLNNVTMLPL